MAKAIWIHLVNLVTVYYCWWLRTAGRVRSCGSRKCGTCQSDSLRIYFLDFLNGMIPKTQPSSCADDSTDGFPAGSTQLLSLHFENLNEVFSNESKHNPSVGGFQSVQADDKAMDEATKCHQPVGFAVPLCTMAELQLSWNGARLSS